MSVDATRLVPLSEPGNNHKMKQNNSQKKMHGRCIWHNAESSSYLPDSLSNLVSPCQTPKTNSNTVRCCLATKLLNTWADAPQTAVMDKYATFF